MEAGDSTRTDAVEIIRESIRKLTYVERKEHRTTVFTKKRVALDGIFPDSSFTTEFVVEKAKALRKRALPLNEYQQLQIAFLQSEENINSFLRVDNVLFSLVRDFSGHDPALQLCAINCCCNVALGNAKACASLAKSIAPYLINELDTLNYPLLDTCIWTVGNLVAGSDKAFEILHAQGCLKYIVSLLRNCDNTILSSVVYTAMHYVHIGFEHIPEDDIVELAKAAKERNLSLDNSDFLWLLALLSSQVACNAYLYNLVPSIVDRLYKSTTIGIGVVPEITACIRILGNTVCEKSGQLAMCLLENPKYGRSELESMLDMLLSLRFIHIRKETLWLIGNLYNHGCVNVKRITQDIVPKLPSLKQAILSTTQQLTLINTDSS